MSGPVKPLKCIMFDVTGTLLKYKHQLGDIYCRAVTRTTKLECPDYERVRHGFHKAYEDTGRDFPCFGYPDVPSKKWWKICVQRSFENAGYKYTDAQMSKIFQRIYSEFGSPSAYEAFPDAQEFLQWAKEDAGLQLGVVSNGTERYGDSILPMLDLHTHMDFQIFSRDVGVRKPNAHIFELALEASGDAELVKHPELTLYIGDKPEKDFYPPKSLGMHAAVLDRFKNPELDAARRDGVPVFEDLIQVRKWLFETNLVPDPTKWKVG